MSFHNSEWLSFFLIFRLEFYKRRPAKATPGILHDNRHFAKNRFCRPNFYIVFHYSDTIGLLEFYFALVLFFFLPSIRPSLYPPIFVSRNPVFLSLSERIPLFSMRDDKSWISCVLKTNRMKNISFHDDVSRVFSPTPFPPTGSEVAS